MKNVNYSDEPISVGEWVITAIVAAIPIVGIVMMLVWAFGKTTNPNKSNWAKAMLIVSIIMMLVMIIMMNIMPSMMESITIESRPAS